MRNILLIAVAVILLSGCHPYRVDIIQGNVVDEKSILQLHPGMSKNKVESILGTPLLVDIFDPDTWLYAYTKQIGGGKIEKKRLTLKFKNNQLVRFD